MANKNTENAASIGAWKGISLLLGLLLALCSPLLGKVFSNSDRVTKIESDRYNRRDARSDHKDILSSRPPKWLKDNVAENSKRIRDLERRSYK